MPRRPKKYADFTLGASQAESAVQAVALAEDGRLDIQVVIDNGAGAAPTDTPVGTWKLFSSADGSTYSHVLDADETLAKIAPSGNVLVSRWVMLEDVPGTSCKLVYTRTSGGAASRARVTLTT
jgi:hypothetical protein